MYVRCWLVVLAVGLFLLRRTSGFWNILPLYCGYTRTAWMPARYTLGTRIVHINR